MKELALMRVRHRGFFLDIHFDSFKGSRYALYIVTTQSIKYVALM